MHSFFLSSLLSFPPSLAYLIFFFGIFIEGDVVLFTAAFLATRGFFSPLPIFLLTFVGVLARDLLLYELGRRVELSRSMIFRWAAGVAEPLDEHLRTSPLRTITLSKFIYGMHFATIIRAGALRLPVTQFLKDDFLATGLWMAAIMTLGLVSSASFFLVRRLIRWVEIALLIGIVILFFLHRVLSKYLRKKI